ncbi:MAG: hypothetical protein GEU80_14175 [Dehalococcoidia bacterium]|nr:hypothetical protein [Dehalococcoidia bacterium]
MTFLPTFLRRPAPHATTRIDDAGGGGLGAVRLPSPRLARAHPYRLPSLVALLCVAAIAATWLASAEVIAALRDAVAWLEARDTVQGRAFASVGLAALGALGVVLAWGRTTSPRRPVQLAGGRGTIEVDEVTGRLRAMLLERPDVRGARVAVENRQRRGVLVVAEVDVTPDARLRETLEAAHGLAERLFHEQLGVRMIAAPAIELHYEELELRPAGTRATSA